MKKGPRITSLVKLSALLLLSEGKRHGYELIKELGKKFGKQISAGEVYPFLKNLKKYNLVITKKVGAREKKVYSLSSAGKVFVHSILKRLDDVVDAAIKSKLIKCAHCGCEIYKGGYSKIMKGKRMTFCCLACAKA